MVRKKFTYAFVLFVKGVYRCGDYKRLGELLNKMTAEEKRLILSGDYAYIVRHLWVISDRRFSQLARQYEETMSARGGKFVKMLKACKTHGHLRWEVPKGQKNDVFETDIQAALRELTEETGMCKESFVLLPGITRIDSYVDERVRYVTKYFVGYGSHEPTASHITDYEISDARWLDLAELAVTDELGGSHMRQVVKPAVNAIKKALRAGYIQ